MNDKFINRIAPKVGDIYDLTADEARQIVRACCINAGRFCLHDTDLTTAITLGGMNAKKADIDDVEWSDIEIDARFCGAWHTVTASLCNDTAGDYTLICCTHLDGDYIRRKSYTFESDDILRR